MKIVKTVEEYNAAVAGQGQIGFVPTMGALHSGHISLVERACRENDIVVVSVFVNPTQFNDKGDLERYPRTLEADAAMLEAAGVSVLFAPGVEDIYPDGDDFIISKASAIFPLTTVMEGVHRPGHFDGVVQVVGRLFDIVCPTRAYFGEKDFQQLAIIRAMVEEDGREVEIVGCEIVRAKDGLALSSRNALLSEEQRAAAPVIYGALSEMRAAIDGGNLNFDELIAATISKINKNIYLCTEYISVVDAATLQEPISGRAVRICAVVLCGRVRLIDNL